MNIINKSKLQLPDYTEDSFRELCHKAHIAPVNVTLIIKRRNRYRGDCWVKKGNPSGPSGYYTMDYHTVIVRIGRQTNQEDFRYVLAHEIGHLKQHLEQKTVLKPGMPTENYAKRFALLTCNCYPKSNYRISRL
ncbi:hypothetical protein LCGC14_0488670 [marine sediment metagenome]|uniref:IrrE N-terminal-like domain-containing protein n=1 Tax=marine sediment metagenome TaxID=412755 RepID=A0A0F9S748_9ZZZZ